MHANLHKGKQGRRVSIARRGSVRPRRETMQAMLKGSGPRYKGETMLSAAGRREAVLGEGRGEGCQVRAARGEGEEGGEEMRSATLGSAHSDAGRERRTCCRRRRGERCMRRSLRACAGG